MRQDGPHKDLLDVVVNYGNQPVLITCDVEHRIFANLIGIAEDFLNVGKVVPLGRLHDSDPMSQRRFRVGMNLPELFERSLRDQPHKGIFANC